MRRFNVVMTAPTLAAAAVALLDDAGGTIHYMTSYPSAAAVAALAGTVQAHAILSRQGPVGAAAMDASPRLRVVARHGVGVDDVDVPAALARGILVTRAPGSNTAGVAEHALAMILALAKNLRPAGDIIGTGGWRDGSPAPRDLAGLRLGLVGYGAIGQAVARLATAVGMDVAYTGRTTGLPLASLLPRSDVLSLHCPWTTETDKLVDATALATLPPGAMLVNTARGGLLDEDALLAALGTGHIAGAALDVFRQEPPPQDHPLRRHPRVIVTPHAAGTTPAALERMGVMAAECIVAALTGTALPAERLVRG